MTRESLAFGLSGVFFGVLIGWIVGSQQAVTVTEPAPAPAATQQDAAPADAPAPQPVDAAQATALERQAGAEPGNAAVRIELGNMYFDAERFDQAATWYEAALKLTPKNADVSTDLAIAYFRLNQVDRALAQIDHSLAVDPKHLKTLLNQGLIRAFGKRDLDGATESWKRVVALAPNSEEARRAQQGLDGIRAAHPDGTTTPSTGSTGGR
jgi:cytochrome c-type biogenesis protein CcmH/NrfG